MSPTSPATSLGHAARQRFCAQVGRVLPKLSDDAREQLNQLLDVAFTLRDMQAARDALTEFERCSRGWIDGVRASLQQSLLPRHNPQAGHTVPGRLELLATEVVEDQLQVSKLALALHDGLGSEWNDLRLRLLQIDQRADLPTQDVVRPESLAKTLWDEWIHAGLSRETWKLLAAKLLPLVGQRLAEAYQETNRFLVSNGVMPDIELRHAVRKAPAGASAGAAEPPRGHAPQAPSGFGPTVAARPAPRVAPAPLEVWGKARQQAADLMGRLRRFLGEAGARPPVTGGAAAVVFSHTTGHTTHSTLSPELTDFSAPATTRAVPLSPALQAVLKAPNPPAPWPDAPPPAAAPAVLAAQVQQATEDVRQRSTELKGLADNPTEKATIEIVALMFQSILTEDRLPASLRIWFARLQIPVLRVALAEPDFFGSLQHPTRRLIDRMGSCALGFDSGLSELNAQALEAEVRRIVQVIEQYPETGRRVFQLALDEFQAFLARQLPAHGAAERLVTVAQQVEQKETLAVQYTIELRKLLNDMPVRDGVRDFLFKVWTEVLAISTVKSGPQHADTLALKQTASDLLWAASAKPTRNERAKAIAQLPGLLVRLRQGMATLGLSADEQEAHIKTLSETMADAFMSRTESIPPEQLEAVTRNLSALENFLPADGMGDLELDAETIEMITGIDASHIEVITHGGVPVSEAGRRWAQELQLGAWFQLDHNGSVSQVQLAWCSQHGQLCLFTTAHQRCFLMQTPRVGAYLQAGLLQPAETEALTVRATRAALEKLEANPERLLA